MNVMYRNLYIDEYTILIYQLGGNKSKMMFVCHVKKQMFYFSVIFKPILFDMWYRSNIMNQAGGYSKKGIISNGLMTLRFTNFKII